MTEVAYDTMIAAHLHNEELSVSLQTQAGLVLGVDNWGKGIVTFGDKDKPPTPLWGPEGMAWYCGRDTGYTHLLYEQGRGSMAQHPAAKLLKRAILPGQEAYAQIEINGIWVDPERLTAREIDNQRQIDEALEKALSYVPEEFRATAKMSNEHFLRRWLFGDRPDGLGLTPISQTATGRASVDEETLKALEPLHPAVASLMAYRKRLRISQFYKQWRDRLDPDSRIHPHFNFSSVVTGRRSCTDPNLQQVPRDKEVRSILGAPPGWLFLEADYSQVEVRVAAWFAGSESMMEVFNGGGDIYRYVAAALYKKSEAEVAKSERQAAKAVVLGFLYGMGAVSLVRYAWDMFGIRFTIEEATAFRDGFFDLFPELLRWHDRQRRMVHARHRVESPLGRVRNLIRVLSIDRMEQGRAERQAINSTVQGFGGDMTLMAMVELHRQMDPAEIMAVGDVHDALLFQVREDVWRPWAKRVLTAMERPAILGQLNVHPPLRLKAEAKIGTHWSDPAAVEFSLDNLDEVEFAKPS